MSYISNEKRLSKHTLLAYETDLNQFKAFYEASHGNIEIEKANYADLRSWVVSLSEKHIDNRSINRKMASLKAFYHCLLIKKKIEENPAKQLKALKVSKNLPVYLEEKNTEKLLDVFEGRADFEGLRDKVIIEFLYGTGIRLSELIGIKNADLDLIAGRVKVLGKRNKYRIIPLNQGLVNLVKQYLICKAEQFKEEYLLVTDSGKMLYPMFVQRKVKKYLDLVSTLNKKSPHVMRHTFATQLLNRGADLNAIKELLGHSSLAATQIYTHNSITQLKDIHKKSHPKS